MALSEVQKAVEAIRSGEPVLLPTDGVYGLCATAFCAEATERLYLLKGRAQTQSTALIAADVATLLDCVPELRGRSEAIVGALLPGPYTLVLPNPAARFPWLNGARADAIGVRVAQLPASTQSVLDAVGAVVATSANDPGQPAAASLDEVPERIGAACGATLDGGRLSGEPSTVIDFTGDEPVVLREGSASSVDAIHRVRRALST